MMKDHFDQSDSLNVNQSRTRSSDSHSDEVVTVDKFETEVESLREEIRSVADRQIDLMDKVHKDMGSMKRLLQQLVVSQGGRGSDGMYLFNLKH